MLGNIVSQIFRVLGKHFMARSYGLRSRTFVSKDYIGLRLKISFSRIPGDSNNSMSAILETELSFGTIIKQILWISDKTILFSTVVLELNYEHSPPRISIFIVWQVQENYKVSLKLLITVNSRDSFSFQIINLGVSFMYFYII